MKLFVVAAMGAALMAGCAPFEHGHYSNDVSYQNTSGDPAGTPLVYLGDTQNSSRYPSTSYASAKPQHDWNHGSQYQTQSVAYAQPIQQSYTQQASYQPVQQEYVQQAAYQPVQQAAYQPVQQSYVQQPVQQSYVQQAAYVEPAAHSYHNTPVATSYGGSHRVDADGYAICDIPWPSHAAHQTPHYKARF